MTADVLMMVGLTMQALSDLRTRTAPLAEIFFLIGALVGAAQDPVRVLMAMAVVLWAMGIGPAVLGLVFLFHPTAFLLWPLAFLARNRMVGLGDVLVLGGIACTLPWPALCLVLLGLELWRQWWRLRDLTGPMPLLPGAVIGFGVYLVTQL